MDGIKNKGKLYILGIVWFVIIFAVSNFNVISNFFGSSNSTSSSETVTLDENMSTNSYDVNIVVGEDNSYSVNEQIDVTFDTYRHGIYRYIGENGTIIDTNNAGKMASIPYYTSVADVDVKDYNYEIDSEDGNSIIRIGDEDMEVTGNQLYDIDYTLTNYTDEGYNNVYLNIYGNAWQNEIPAGSSFSITLPKDFDESTIRFYAGEYGASADAGKYIEYTVKDNVITGTLTKSLDVGEGLTLYIPMEKGYFTNLHTADVYKMFIIAVATIILCVIAFLFVLFGRDEKIIPSVQFAPPDGMDSAAAGYVIDGTISDKDVTSLIIYLANEGYLKIKNQNEMSLIKLKDIKEEAPEYQKEFFNELFGGDNAVIGSEVKLSSLEYKMAETINSVKVQIKGIYKGLYTRISQIARVLAVVLWVIAAIIFASIVPGFVGNTGIIIVSLVLIFVGMIFLSSVVDNWYSYSNPKRKGFIITGTVLSFGASGLIPSVVFSGVKNSTGLNFVIPTLVFVGATLIDIGFISFMRKRRDEYVKTMGSLVGLREYIEKAELDRMKVMAQYTPELFYNVLPYAYVFGISDILLDKMQGLTLPAPNWYDDGSGNIWFDYMVMRSFMHTSLPNINSTLATPKPEKVGNGTGFGGGFSGGGFSGGGFGGGGGGSW